MCRQGRQFSLYWRTILEGRSFQQHLLRPQGFQVSPLHSAGRFGVASLFKVNTKELLLIISAGKTGDEDISAHELPRHHGRPVCVVELDIPLLPRRKTKPPHRFFAQLHSGIDGHSLNNFSRYIAVVDWTVFTLGNGYY